MPGPGNKKAKNQAIKQKQKQFSQEQSSNQVAIPTSLPNDVDDTPGSIGKIDFLCKLLKIPDISSRSGLKAIHKDFANIYDRLDKTYTTFRSSDAIIGCIIAIYAKMCADTILRDRLFQEKDLLSKIMKLLEKSACRLTALQALCALTHRSDTKIRTEIAKKTPILLGLLDEDKDNWKVAELVLTVISHAVVSVVGDTKPPSSMTIKALDIPMLLHVVTEQVDKPTATSLLIDHALDILVGLPMHCGREISNNSSALNLLLACTRSPDIQTRGIAINGILRFAVKGSEPDNINYDPQRLMSSMQSRMPDHLVDAIMDFGPMDQSEMIGAAFGTKQFTSVMMQVVQNRNLFELGMKVSDMILQSEYAVVDGMFDSEVVGTGKRDNYDFGLPFRRWADSLPHCANALRAGGESYFLDKADILDLKYMIMKRRTAEAQELALKAIERNPNVPFFYYARSLGPGQQEALRAARKGLKCKGLTPYVRNAMLYRACESGASLGLSAIQNAGTDKQWDEAIAFIMGARDDAETFMVMAPPDARSMKSAVFHYYVLSMIIEGSDIDVEFSKMKNAERKLSLADDFAKHLNKPISKTQLRQAHDLLLKRMPDAAKEWDARIQEIARLHEYRVRKEARVIDPEKAEDNLATWLEDVHLGEEDNHDNTGGPQIHMTHSRLNFNHVALHQCSWCGTTSAVLRKCSRCEKTRYCDATCQKQHWSTHKKTCNVTA
ncbi:hypothetical protein SCHPADRAFT_714482 [Schizopora paradoxa]|uniref:MYND-type domain-containing protein n=1 Tax=Schizopora paradoxa TaxID=27342 RepID=A0A0H2R1U5_9AGAM|nr:hypothetical protein SCHPADRAFT_714482 [Schizopora paradoxa]